MNTPKLDCTLSAAPIFIIKPPIQLAFSSRKRRLAEAIRKPNFATPSVLRIHTLGGYFFQLTHSGPQTIRIALLISVAKCYWVKQGLRALVRAQLKFFFFYFNSLSIFGRKITIFFVRKLWLTYALSPCKLITFEI